MSIKVNYSKKTTIKSSNNIVLFSDAKFNINSSNKYLTNSELSYIKDLLKTFDLKKNMFVFEITSKKKIILISIKDTLENFDIENLGAEFYKKINQGKTNQFFIFSDSIVSKKNNFLGYFLHGMKLKSYEFFKYKTKKETKSYFN